MSLPLFVDHVGKKWARNWARKKGGKPPDLPPFAPNLSAGYWSAGSIPMLQKVYIHSDKTSDDVANAMAEKRRVAMLNGGAEQKKKG